jgi:hypothetical protein
MRDVEAFAHEKDLVEHIPLLRKGALVAQDPENYDRIDGDEALTDEEKLALENEVKHKWRMPMRLFLTIATCSIGAAVQGWDQTGVRALYLMPEEVTGGCGTDANTRSSRAMGQLSSSPRSMALVTRTRRATLFSSG